MRPPFAYYGGKVGLAKTILGLMPPHRVYVEPFFGAGAVFFAKTQVPHEILNDTDSRIVAFFRSLRDHPAELARICALTPYSRDEYNHAMNASPSPDQLEQARRFWVLVTMGFGHHGRDNTGFSVTTKRTTGTAPTNQTRVARFESIARRLADATIENLDGLEVIRRHAKSDDTLIYADPPYPRSTRVSSSARWGGDTSGDYVHDMLTDDDHRELAETLHATPAAVILSSYPSDLYDELYDGWVKVEVSAKAHSSNASRSDRGARTEVLWSNRPLAYQAQLGLTEALSAAHSCDQHRHPDDDDDAGHDLSEHLKYGPAEMGHDHRTEDGTTHDIGCDACLDRYDD